MTLLDRSSCSNWSLSPKSKISSLGVLALFVFEKFMVPANDIVCNDLDVFFYGHWCNRNKLLKSWKFCKRWWWWRMRHQHAVRDLFPGSKVGGSLRFNVDGSWGSSSSITKSSSSGAQWDRGDKNIQKWFYYLSSVSSGFCSSIVEE